MQKFLHDVKIEAYFLNWKQGELTMENDKLDYIKMCILRSSKDTTKGNKSESQSEGKYFYLTSLINGSHLQYIFKLSYTSM